jgi:hypothetical protein
VLLNPTVGRVEAVKRLFVAGDVKAEAAGPLSVMEAMWDSEGEGQL